MKKRALYQGTAVGVAILAVFLAANYFVRPKSTFPASAGPVAAISSVGATSSLASPSASMTEYRNLQYGFSLFYPNDLAVSSFGEGNGASTIVFQNTTEVRGFQIFVVPYTEAQISEERFRKDVPSGVREHPVNILVGGVPAVMFFSKNAILGDTVEVWVIKNGYLFEITAPKPLAVWLANIMQSWVFS